MLLLMHGEVTDPAVDVFDREAVFIDQVLIPLRRDFPGLKIVFEHITTKDAAEYVAAADAQTARPSRRIICCYNRNAIFSGGLRPHAYCLPVLKRELHREALVKQPSPAMPKFFLGTDSAPHARHTKEA
jgi:dihydroorotase